MDPCDRGAGDKVRGLYAITVVGATARSE